MSVRDLLIEEIKHLSEHDVNKLYKYVRRYLIADINGLADPLKTVSNSDYDRCAEDLQKQVRWNGWEEPYIRNVLKRHFA